MGPEKVEYAMKTGYETFEHGADMGIRGWGATMSEAFANGAKAMFSLMVEDMDAVRPKHPRDISCESFDKESLFTAWLNALLAEADIHGMIFREFDLEIQDCRIRGTARGEPFDTSRHARGIEVKGATYTELAVRQHKDGWLAQCVVDV
jgi:SHS2 domain-containing protein